MGPDEAIVLHYEDGYDEESRLSKDGVGRLEMLRTRAILERHLPDPPAAVLDVGGGPGVYAVQLNNASYRSRPRVRKRFSC